MRLEERLAAHFVDTSQRLNGPPGRFDAVVAGRRPRLRRFLAGGGLALCAVVASAVMLMTSRPDPAEEELEPSRVAVTPYVAVQERLASPTGQTLFIVTGATPSYWRIATLDVYDDHVWKLNRDFTAFVPAVEQPVVGAGRRLVRHQVEILNLSEIWLPVEPDPVTIDVEGDVAISVDSDGTTFTVEPARADSDGLRYTVVSSLATPTPEQLRASPSVAPDVVSQNYLATNGVPDQLRSLARELAEGLPTDYDRIIALQDHLRTYELETTPKPTGADTDPLVLLLNEKRGSATELAGAMALMARELGIPSRVAIGFTAGVPGSPAEPASDIDTWEVRDRDAHAWPEIYFDGVGWIPFEPALHNPAPDIGDSSQQGERDVEASDAEQTRPGA